MDKSILSRQQRNLNVAYYLHQHPECTSTISALVQEINDLDAENAAADTLIGNHIKAADGKSDTKSDAENNLSDLIIFVSGAGYVYGKKNNLLELMATTNINPSDLTVMREAELAHRGLAIADAVAPYADKLGEYDVTNAQVDALKAASEKFVEAKQAVSGAVSGKRDIEAEIEAHHKAALVIRDNIKRLMRRFQKSDPGFYLGYKDACKLRSSGVRHRPVDPPPAQNTNGNGAVNPALA